MITFRRRHLDKFLKDVSPQFKGVVLDIGGKKKNTRGEFTPPVQAVESWKYVNIDEHAAPDIMASADDIPLPDNHADFIVMTELLEHVPNPEAVLREAQRLLKPGGKIFVTMPFLYQVHADPHDYTRWTADMLRMQAQDAGFAAIDIAPMGGLFSVIYDLFRAHIYRVCTPGTLSFKIKVKALSISACGFSFMDCCASASQNHITTGWALTATKPGK